MCRLFQTGGVRKASQKSWLVAAITNKISSATSPSALNGKAYELGVIGGLGQFVIEAGERVLHREPLDHERCVQQRDQEGQNAEVTSIVE